VPATYLDTLDPRADDERRRGHVGEPAPGVKHWVSEVGGEVRGWCSTGPTRDEGLDPASVHELWSLYVDPSHWRGGHGAALLSNAVSDARGRGFSEMTLWVLEANPIGRSFYEREGFRPDGSAKRVCLAGVELPHVRYRLRLGGV
jgi:GNAT superfamily N-acetyltransferase